MNAPGPRRTYDRRMKQAERDGDSEAPTWDAGALQRSERLLALLKRWYSGGNYVPNVNPVRFCQSQSFCQVDQILVNVSKTLALTKTGSVTAFLVGYLEFRASRKDFVKFSSKWGGSAAEPL